jgi:hypothetical protein
MDFTVTLSNDDWDPIKGGWRCPALQIPETEIKNVYVDGSAVDPKLYAVNSALCIIRWSPSTHPKQASAHVHVRKALSTGELTSRWKKAAIILPIIGTLGAAFIATRLSAPAPGTIPKQGLDNIGTIKLYEASNDFLATGSKYQFAPLLKSTKREAWFIGTTFYISIDQFYSLLLSKLADGVDLNFLILNPDSQGEAFTARMLGVSEQELAFQCYAGIRILFRMSAEAHKANYPGTINVKLVNDEITTRLYFFDPKTDGGFTFFVPQVSGTNSQTLPGFVLANAAAKFHAQYFSAALVSWNGPGAQTLESWKAAHPDFK